jgi:hypothetical protein
LLRGADFFVGTEGGEIWKNILNIKNQREKIQSKNQKAKYNT